MVGPRMRIRSPLAVFFPRAATALLLAGTALCAQQPPDRAPAAILRIMERVADWQLANPSSHPVTDWTQGAGDAGLMALAGISGSPKYRDAMLAVGQQSGWQPGARIYHADDHCVGQTYAELYLLYREPRMIAGLRDRFDGILERPSAVKSMDFGRPEHGAIELWSWCDSLFMGPPAWMRLYRATGDARYMDFAVRNWWLTTDYLYDKDEHLFFRDSTYFNRREANGRKVFWSRGNGWVMAGLVRVLQDLPSNHTDRPRFERLFAAMAEKVASCQQGDGLWRASLLDPASFPLQETSGSGFFTYALAWGINEGLLDRGRYSGVVSKAWAGLERSVSADGRLTHVQPIGADPKNFPGDSTEVYGVGAFLLAGSEVYKMALAMPDEAMSATVIVTVSNPSAFFRGEETVQVDLGKLSLTGNPAVMDGTSSRILDSQTYADEPGEPANRLLFQVDLAPGETRRFLLLGTHLPAVPAPIVRTYVRQVAERYNDVAWESDRTAHRMYSQDLIKGEGTISSGIDVWSKRSRSMIVNEWYKRIHYHEDDGDGLDDYQVGRSRGCGGLGIWSGGKLYVSINFRDARIITTGPIRSEFELAYDAWDAGGRRVSERKRISIDAGSNMSRAESVFTCDGAAPLHVGIGIAQRAGSDNASAQDVDSGWMTYWQAPDRDRGSIGCAVVMTPGDLGGFAMESASVPAIDPEKQLKPGIEGLPPVGNMLAITQVAPGKPLVYYFGAGWSRSGDFPTRDSWTRYVARFADRLRAPLVVKTGH
jgi:unsaturated rhamnogalacturonyl hydrolase